MLILRSLIFNIVFSVVFICAMIIALPILFMDKEIVFIFWNRFSLVLSWITKIFAGISVKVEGKFDRKGVIYAMRHESTWETLTLIHFFDHPIFVMKKELFDIPIFGAMARKSESISIDRENGARSLAQALRQVKECLSKGRTVIIFPEGTRMPTGVFQQLRRGISLFYSAANCPVIPVIHNSGKFWPRRGFIKYPGKITIKVFPVIEPGLSHDDFMQKLNDTFQIEVEKLAKG